MGNFFNDDVPSCYQEHMVNVMTFHLEKGDVSALYNDFTCYDIFCPLEVQKKMIRITTSLGLKSDLDAVKKLFEDYALI